MDLVYVYDLDCYLIELKLLCEHV